MGDDVATEPHLANSMLGALLAVVHRAAGDEGTAAVLARAGECRSVAELNRPDGWSAYPQGLALFQAAAEILDDPDVGRKAGVEVFRRYAGTEVLALLRSIGSPEEMLRVYPAISAKQSTITLAEVVEVGEGHGLLSMTSPEYPRDRLFCGYTVGALSQFPVLFGMEPADVEELECQTRGDSRCLMRIQWDPTSSLQAGLEREVVDLRDQLAVLTHRFEALESVARELSSSRDVDSLLETITRQAGVAIRAPRYLLVARLPGDVTPRVHHVGFTDAAAAATAQEILAADLRAADGNTLVVDIASVRGSFGRLAAFYPKKYRFLPQERSILLAYAGHAAAALETAAALDEVRDRNASLAALLALGRVLAQESTRVEVAQRLADTVSEIVPCDRTDVFLWEAGDALLRRAASSVAALAPEAVPVAVSGTELVDRLVTGSSPIVVGGDSDPVLTPLVTLSGLDSGLVVPITARGTLFGVVVVGPHTPSLDTEAMRERLTGVASLGATALDGLSLLDEVRYQALHDPVTDLANSRLFEDRVDQSLAIARRHGGQLALLFVDLDRFKSVNDTYGHKVGDELLRVVADRLLASVRAEDTVARIGGDEFGVLLQGISRRDDVEAVATKLVAAFKEPLVIGDHTVSSGVSIGIALFPYPDDTCDSIVSRADAAMYKAKAAGRGCYRIYEPWATVPSAAS